MRTLIQIVFTAACIAALPESASAQNRVNGVYKTKEDFISNRLSDSESTSDQNRIVTYRGSLTVYRNGQPVRYKPGSLYGYYQDGAMYRIWIRKRMFSDNGYYRVVKNGALVIYSKQSVHHRSNGHTWYYYSMGTDGEIRRLTKRNLAKDFSNQPEFLSAARAQLEKAEPSEWLVISDLYANFNKPR